jgi:hypothetical protein
MTRPRIRAVVEDGPRAGETFAVDVESADSPPPEIMLPNGHHDGGSFANATGAVSTYHLVGPDDQGDGYVYRVVHHEE